MITLLTFCIVASVVTYLGWRAGKLIAETGEQYPWLKGMVIGLGFALPLVIGMTLSGDEGLLSLILAFWLLACGGAAYSRRKEELRVKEAEKDPGTAEGRVKLIKDHRAARMARETAEFRREVREEEEDEFTAAKQWKAQHDKKIRGQ